MRAYSSTSSVCFCDLPFRFYKRYRFSSSKFTSIRYIGHYREPEPLKPEQKRLLTSEAATERLVNASVITRREAKQRHVLGERIAWLFHNELGKGAKGDIVLSSKFVGSPLAETIRTTLSNAVGTRTRCTVQNCYLIADYLKCELHIQYTYNRRRKRVATPQ